MDQAVLSAAPNVHALIIECATSSPVVAGSVSQAQTLFYLIGSMLIMSFVSPAMAIVSQLAFVSVYKKFKAWQDARKNNATSNNSVRESYPETIAKFSPEDRGQDGQGDRSA